MDADPSDRLGSLFRVHVTERKAGDAVPPAEVLHDIADLCRQGVVRDLEIDEAFVLGTVALVADCLRATFDESLVGSAASDGPPVKRSGAVNCCPPPGTKAMPGTKGGFVSSGGKPMTVAPWLAGGGGTPGMGKFPGAMKGVGGGPMGGFVPGGGLDKSKPMTVAPWISAPGSSIQKALAGTDVLDGGTSGAAEMNANRIVHVCEVAKDVLTVQESADAAAALDDDALKQVAQTAREVVERMCMIGVGGDGASVLGANGEPEAAAALKGLVQALYLRFHQLRAGIRRCLALALTSAVSKCMHVPRAQAGVRLHAMDGGARASSITLAGASAGLQLLAGIVRGFRRPPARHMSILWDTVMPLHASNGMVDDLTPLLTLVHKPLTLCEVAFLEADPSCAHNLLRQLVAYWPPVTSANSSKEVLLLHELEVLLEHCRPDALADAELRDLVVDRMVSSFEGAKNFRVAERALLLFKADGVVSLLRNHQEHIIPRMVPKLMAASLEHWNHSVLRMIGLALQTLDEMDPHIFERLVGEERTEEVRAVALRLNPPEDLTKIEQDAATRIHAMRARREAGNIDLYCLALGHDLGIGAYSRVRFGKLIAKDLQQSLWPQVAVKIMDLDVIQSQHYEANVRREIQVLHSLDHPAIVRFIGSFDTKQSTYIVLEYMSNGDLQQVLAAKGSLSVASARFVCAEVLTGLAHMHEKGIVYGDLKPENILLDEKNHCKLSDFGSSRLVGVDAMDEGGSVVDRVEGTLEYIAPEVAAGVTSSSFASDAWALGCVLHQLIAGHTPVLPDEDDTGARRGHEEDNRRALQHIVRFTAEREHAGMFSDDFPPEPRPLLQRLLSIEPSNRLGATSGGLWQHVMDNAFFENIDWAGLPRATPPSLTTGMVTAAHAQDRRWNRRKMSMMYSPMPEKYVSGASGDVCELPEEPEGSAQVILPDRRPTQDTTAQALDGSSSIPDKPPVPAFAGLPPAVPRCSRQNQARKDVILETE